MLIRSQIVGGVAMVLDISCKKVQVGNNQEMAQSERNTHSINRGWEKTKMTLSTYTRKTYSKPSEQLFPNRRPLSYLNWTKV